jgi:hypothetical protein
MLGVGAKKDSVTLGDKLAQPRSKSIGNPKLQDQLRNLMKMYGRKGSKAEITAGIGKSKMEKTKTMEIFESAFKKRLARTHVGNKAANEVILAAMEADYRAKMEYQKRKRQSILEGKEEETIFIKRRGTILPANFNEQPIQRHEGLAEKKARREEELKS